MTCAYSKRIYYWDFTSIVVKHFNYALLARFYEKKIPKKFDQNKRAKNINYTISYRKSICLITQFLVPIKPVYVNSDTAPFAI